MVPPEGYFFWRDLSYYGQGWPDGLCQLVDYVLGGGDEELVVFAARGREDSGVVPEGTREFSCIVLYRKEGKVYVASHAAPVAHAAYVRGEAVGEVHHGVHAEFGGGASCFDPRLWP